MQMSNTWSVLACLALVAAAPMPEARAGESRMGGFLGVNLADRYGSDSSRDENMRVRSCVGGLVEIGFSERGALRIEPSLVGKGSQGHKVDEPPMDGTFTWWRSFEYLEIPVLLKWRLAQTKTWTSYAIGGPSLGFLLVARYQSKGTGWYVAEQDHEYAEEMAATQRGEAVSVPTGD